MDIVKAFKERNIKAYLVKNREAAKKKAISLIPRDWTIAFGGSMTLNEVGIMEELRKGGYKLIDRESISSAFTRHFAMKASMNCGVFLSSANAVTEDGQIVNVDGWGNRVNSIAYGPETVILVVGKNKIVKDLDAALKRLREISPRNTKRLMKKTPCAETGICTDCRSPDRICNVLSIIQFQNDPNRMHVIIADEELGY